MDQENHKFKLKNVNMDYALAKAHNLNLTDIAVLNTITLLDNKDHCFASNGYLADVLEVSERTVSASINKLIEEGIISVVNFDGRKRTVKSNYRSVLQNRLEESCEAGSQESSSQHRESLPEIYTNIYVQEDKEKKIKENNCADESAHPFPSLFSSEKDKKEVIKHCFIPKKLQPIFDYWERKPNDLQKHKRNTKVLKESISRLESLMEGTLLPREDYPEWHDHKFTEEEIKQSIDNFALAAHDHNYDPQNDSVKKYMRKMYIDRFLWNPDAKKWEKSLFIKYLKKPRCLNVEDTSPNLTKKIKRWYVANVLGGIEPEFSAEDMNCFKYASQRLSDFYKKHKHKFALGMNDSLMDFVDDLCDAIRKDVDDNFTKVTPKWFCSDYTFNKRLPTYLYDQAAIRDEYYEDFGIKNNDDGNWTPPSIYDEE